MRDREPWEWELTRVIHIAREAGLSEVVLAIQNSICHINVLKRKANDLDTIKRILK